MNAITTIHPYREHGLWVFDDPRVGLTAEPFVGAVNDMIDEFVRDIPDATLGFTLMFSDAPFPGAQVTLDLQRPEHDGTWYQWQGRSQEGWLCSALLKYFPTPPKQIHLRAEPLRTESRIAVPREALARVLAMLESGDTIGARKILRDILGTQRT